MFGLLIMWRSCLRLCHLPESSASRASRASLSPRFGESVKALAAFMPFSANISAISAIRRFGSTSRGLPQVYKITCPMCHNCITIQTLICVQFQAKKKDEKGIRWLRDGGTMTWLRKAAMTQLAPDPPSYPTNWFRNSPTKGTQENQEHIQNTPKYTVSGESRRMMCGSVKHV